MISRMDGVLRSAIGNLTENQYENLPNPEKSSRECPGLLDPRRTCGGAHFAPPRKLRPQNATKRATSSLRADSLALVIPQAGNFEERCSRRRRGNRRSAFQESLST
uniref:Uncharacterized protein n=1 Tax=Steinernema glaseri TaxID=37863 RepID=A0A1I8AMK6_9BILA